MPPALLPANEAERLAALRSYEVLDSACEATFDNITQLAAQLTGSTMALVSLIDAERQWFKSRVGLDVTETPREQAFCGYALLDPRELLVVSDARLDPRFADNPLVVGHPQIRFYAGAPLVNQHGAALGTLCVLDPTPRAMTEDQRQALRRLAETVMTTLELRRAMNRMRELALLDSLTGLPNRIAVMDALERAIARQERHGDPFALLYADLDGFKRVNDLEGHEAGDTVLRQVALAFQATTRHGDMAGRIGGDEFAMVLAGCEADALAAAERVRTEVQARMLARGCPVTISIGAAAFHVAPRSAGAALASADRLMYAAKLAGRNQVRHRLGHPQRAVARTGRLWPSGSAKRSAEGEPGCDPMGREDLARLVLDCCRDAVVIARLGEGDTVLTYVNATFERVTGYSRAEAIGRNCRYLQGSDRRQPEIAQLRDAIRRRAPVAVTLRNYAKDGTLFWNELSLTPLLDRWGRATHYLGLMRDVTAARTAASLLGEAARRDRLTGVLNRHAFNEAFDRLAAEGPGRFLVVKVELLALVGINGSYGYDAGDEMVMQAVRRLSSTGPVLIGRTSGSKFAMAFRLSPGDDGAVLVERVAAAMEPPFSVPGAVLRADLAIGYVAGEAGSAALTLVKQAGSAMHQAKTAREGRPQRFDKESDRAARRKMRLIAELQQAVADDDFLHHYQPKFDLQTGRLVGAEALLRWNQAVFGLQQPNSFIPLAEETGLILAIEARGLRQVASFAARLNRDRPVPLIFSVNISPLEVTRGDLVGLMRSVLAQAGAEPGWLTLELTEGLLTETSPEVLSTFRHLRDLGVGLSIDDFGTGHSSLRYLESFPISEIKIDRSFVRDIARSGAKRIIAETVIALGQELGVNVVAEGIETEQERRLLQGMKCPQGQGYLFGHPMGEEDFLALASAPAVEAVGA